MIEIKKYSNRRLYNTETSAYITLDDIVTLIKKELDFKVVDVDTQSDITSSILTQIILEKENAGINLIPSHILKQIILFNENKKSNMMFDFLTNSMNAANSNNIFTKLNKHNDSMFNPTWNNFLIDSWPIFYQRWNGISVERYKINDVYQDSNEKFYYFIGHANANISDMMKV